MEHIQAFLRSEHPVAALYSRHPGFFKFLAVGGLNTALDITLFFIFSSIFKLHVVPANILSTSITICLSFYLNHSFVFRSQKRKITVASQFIAITLFNAWVIQSFVITLVIHAFGGSSFGSKHQWTMNIIAKLCSVGVAFLLNFTGYRYIFSTKKLA